jgi:hypothetical protein
MKDFINPPMPEYIFRIRQGSYSSDIPADFADDAAAWEEGLNMCRDLILTILHRPRDSPEWRLEITDGSGSLRHIFRLTTESFNR